MSDPCLSCPLPDCDELSPGCAVRNARNAKRRVGNAERCRRYRKNNRMAALAQSVAGDGRRAVNAALREMREAA